MDLNTLPAFGTHIASLGGIFAAIVRAPQIDGIEQPPVALIVAAAEHEFTGQWGEYGQEIPGAASRTDGRSNTQAMATAGSPIGKRVHEATIEGHADWHVPSLGELNSAAANVPEAFQADGIYWTSTQHSRLYSFAQSFDYGTSYWGGKGNELLVRPFRRVHLEALTA